MGALRAIGSRRAEGGAISHPPGGGRARTGSQAIRGFWQTLSAALCHHLVRGHRSAIQPIARPASSLNTSRVSRERNSRGSIFGRLSFDVSKTATGRLLLVGTFRGIKRPNSGLGKKRKASWRLRSTDVKSVVEDWSCRPNSLFRKKNLCLSAKVGS